MRNYATTFLPLLLCLMGTATTCSANGIIFDAIREDDPIKIKEAVVENGDDINEIGPGGQTPLVHAILMGKVEAVKTLLELKADYTIPEKDGYTVFHAAGFQGRAEIVTLLANHVDPESGSTKIRDDFLMLKHKDGYYPFHRPCWGRQERHTETVQAFLDLGIDFNLQADNGKTCAEMTKNDDTTYLLRTLRSQATAKKQQEKLKKQQQMKEEASKQEDGEL